MHTEWETGESAQDYSHNVEAADWRIMGYPAVFAALGLSANANAHDTVIDYGCGPGFVARHVAETFGRTVVGVDTSGSMIRLAAREYAHRRVTYRRIEPGSLSFLPDSSAGGCLSCYVFMQMPDRLSMATACTEIRRVLRPGAPFAMLNTNPDSVGVQFATLRNGEPGRAYAPGDPMTTVLRTDQGTLTLRDYYWRVDDYVDAVASAGFHDLAVEHLPPPTTDPTPRSQFLLIRAQA
ncbi:class I SAM-dependent methyltransferase [Micromonospora okii]|uniref:class I SAM-dependent methyltransferase n=1 Tax=Micromonospora okii TaxID=1182970 RepID=UPI001E5DBA6F|nr:class I SAM-dependent methyltransferase [Micromonospora okii]